MTPSLNTNNEIARFSQAMAFSQMPLLLRYRLFTIIFSHYDASSIDFSAIIFAPYFLHRALRSPDACTFLPTSCLVRFFFLSDTTSCQNIRRLLYPPFHQYRHFPALPLFLPSPFRSMLIFLLLSDIFDRHAAFLHEASSYFFFIYFFFHFSSSLIIFEYVISGFLFIVFFLFIAFHAFRFSSFSPSSFPAIIFFRVSLINMRIFHAPSSFASSFQ